MFCKTNVFWVSLQNKHHWPKLDVAMARLDVFLRLMTNDAVAEEELTLFDEANGGPGAAPAVPGAPSTAMGCMGLGSFDRGRWSAPGVLGGRLDVLTFFLVACRYSFITRINTLQRYINKYCTSDDQIVYFFEQNDHFKHRLPLVRHCADRALQPSQYCTPELPALPILADAVRHVRPACCSSVF